MICYRYSTNYNNLNNPNNPSVLLQDNRTQIKFLDDEMGRLNLVNLQARLVCSEADMERCLQTAYATRATQATGVTRITPITLITLTAFMGSS